MIYILPDSAGYTWGTTADERSAPFPCDRFLPQPDDTLYRGVTIRAGGDVVFRWLCQMRVAPYSYDWLDNGGRRSPRELLPDLDNLAVGQRFMEIFRLADFSPGEFLTLVMDRARANRLFGEVVVCYAVKPVSPSETRLLVKLLLKRPTRRGFRWIGPILPWGDLVMMRRQLLTLRDLCEMNAGLVHHIG